MTGISTSGLSASRVSHPPGGLLLPKPSGPVSSRWRSQGSRPSKPSRPEVAPASSAVALPACRWPEPGCRVLIPPERFAADARRLSRTPALKLPWVSSPSGVDGLMHRDPCGSSSRGLRAGSPKRPCAHPSECLVVPRLASSLEAAAPPGVLRLLPKEARRASWISLDPCVK